MRNLARIVILAAIAVVGLSSWRLLFPSPEKIIRENLSKLAHSVSFSPSEGTLVRLAHAEGLADFFSTNVEVEIDAPDRSKQRFMDREELVQAAVAIQRSLQELTVEFPDVNITLDPGNQSATADVTARAQAGRQSDIFLQELMFQFEKIDGHWLITGVKTVRVFSGPREKTSANVANRFLYGDHGPFLASNSMDRGPIRRKTRSNRTSVMSAFKRCNDCGRARRVWASISSRKRSGGAPWSGIGTVPKSLLSSRL